MQITRENGFKNTLIFHQLWSKQFTDQNYGHLGLFQVNNMVFRGSTSHASSELIFMFLESGGLFNFLDPPNAYCNFERPSISQHLQLTIHFEETNQSNYTLTLEQYL